MTRSVAPVLNVPKGWERRRLGEVARPRGGTGFPLLFQGGTRPGYPFLKVSDMNLPGNALSITESNNYISESVRQLLGATLFPPGSVIFAKVGAAVFLERKRLLTEASCLDNNMAALIPDTSQVDPQFLLWWMQGFRLSSLVATTALPSVNNRALAGIQLTLPPLPEQRAIAEALSDVDALIESLDRQIAKKEAIKKGAMQALLSGKTRLPGFSGEWVERPISSLATVEMGQSPPGIFYNHVGEGLPLIQGNADIRSRRTISRVWSTVTPKTCAEDDLLLTVRAPVGFTAIAAQASCLGRGVCALLAPRVNRGFLYHALVNAEPMWASLEQGSTFTSANSAQVASFMVKITLSPDEQAAIAAVLSDMDAEIEALRVRRDKTVLVKHGMMQELLTGRTRLV